MIKKHTLTFIEHPHTDPAILQWLADCRENVQKVGAMVTLETEIGNYSVSPKEQFEKDMRNNNHLVCWHQTDFIDGRISLEERDRQLEKLVQAISSVLFPVKE